MITNEITEASVDHNLILDRIYEIALEPSLLDDFIDLWADGNLAAQFADNDDAKTGAFDALFKAHLKRAEAFLQLGDTASPKSTDYLKPYDAFAAFIIDKTLVVERANPGAQAAFGMVAGDRLTELDMDPIWHGRGRSPDRIGHGSRRSVLAGATYTRRSAATRLP